MVLKRWLAKSAFWTLMFVIILLANSCRSGYVTISNDDQEMVMEKAGGELSPERYISVRYMQENLLSLQVLEEQYRSAIKAKNIARADSIQDLLDRRLYSAGGGSYGRTSAGPSVRLQVQNSSEYVIELLNGPFAGTVLNPGESTKDRRPFKVGVYQMELKIYRINSSGSYKRRSNVPIPENRNNPIVVYSS